MKRRSNKSSFSLISIALLVVIGGLLLSGCNLFSSSDPGTVDPTQAQPALGSTPTPEPAVDNPFPTSGGEILPESTSPSEITPAQPETFPDPASYQWELFADRLDSPLFLTHAGDGSNRIFVVEKPGRILIFEDGTSLPEPFLDITGIVNSRSFERGLLGLAFHPNYADNGIFFINYTNSGGNTVVARYQVSEDRNRADPDSAETIMTMRQPFNNHNGGMIAFGPDGYLYIGMGDGGSANDPDENAQDPETLLGKILRVDVDGGDPYGIPAGNAANGLPEIWALGLRNPWRFSFDRATDDLFIGDVGQNQWEEIDFLPAGTQGGANLGWDYFEGSHNFEGDPPEETSFVNPIAEYSHSGTHCSVTGGYVYRGDQLPAWQGIYLYGDYCSGYVWGALPGADGSWQTTQLFQMPAQISSFGEDEAGEVYLVDLLGSIYKLANK